MQSIANLLKPVKHAAVAVPGGTVVHAGVLRRAAKGQPRTYTPACSPARLTASPTGSRRVTCANCQHWHADIVREIHAAQDSEHKAAADALRITEHLPQLVASLAFTIYGDYPGEAMTCGEVDVLALVLTAAGQRHAAETLIISHATGDKEDTNRHIMPAVCWTKDNHLDMRAARMFASRHIDLLITWDVAAKGRWVQPREDFPTAYTVDVAGPERHDWIASTVFVVNADTAQQAAARALRWHVTNIEGADFDPATPDHNGETSYIVKSVKEGVDPGWGHWNDLRSARWTF